MDNSEMMPKETKTLDKTEDAKVWEITCVHFPELVTEVKKVDAAANFQADSHVKQDIFKVAKRRFM